MSRLLLIATGLTLVAGPVAASGLDDFEVACKENSGVALPPATVLGVIMTQSKVPWSPRVIDLYQRTLNPALDGDRLSALKTTDEEAWRRLMDYTGGVIDAAQRGPVSGITATVEGHRPGYGEGARLAALYIAGNTGLLTITCPTVAPTRPGQDVGGTNASTGSSASERHLVIAGDTDSLSSKLGKRSFATFGYTDNEITDTDFIDADVVLGLTGLSDEPVLIPYLAYQRRTNPTDELNDLTLGLTGYWRGGHNEVRWTGSYETDDNLESAVYRAEVEWQFPSPQVCDDQFSDATSAYMTCYFGVRADYADVNDAGDKASLLTVGEYLRVGGWANIAYGWKLSDALSMRLSVSYDIMEPLDGDDGDAEMTRIGLDFLPSNLSRFKFGLSYEDGEDITSLTPSQVFKATLGFRY